MTETSITPESPAPRWVGLAVAALAIVALIGVASGWTANSRAKNLEQSLTTQSQSFKQNEDSLTQRLAKAEDQNAQMQSDLSVVTNKLKVTQSDLAKARKQAKELREQNAKEISDVQTQVNGQLATKASVDDLNKVSGDVGTVKTDLDATKNNLQMTRTEYGTLIARNHDEVETLRRQGERDYYEFTIDKRNVREKVGDLMVELHGVNPKRNLFSVTLFVDDQRYDKRNRAVNEPIFFFTHGSRTPLEFVVNQVGKNKIVGYISVPKVQAQPTTTSSGN